MASCYYVTSLVVVYALRTVQKSIIRQDTDFAPSYKGTLKAGYNPLVSKTDDDYIKSKFLYSNRSP